MTASFKIPDAVESLAERFWIAHLRADETEAARIGREMEAIAPMVGYASFEFPDSPASQTAGVQAGAGEQSLHTVQPDTPSSTVEVWNATKRVKMGVFD